MNYGGRTFAAGGAMPMEQLTEFNEGGRHEENGLGGIPQGMNPQGQMNLVEEGETKFDAENYIYSDSLKVDKELAEAFNLNPKMVGKTFADASKMAGRKKSKREGDAIEMAANEKDLMNLMEAQEAFKQARIEEKLQEIAELDPNALPALMGQGQPQGGPQGDPAMGGPMQEAPMIAEQAGGGQPSPEEIAMMQQQQNMAMGQQEGMMRAGGKLPKEILKARVKSHMSPAQADAYVNSYGNGGYTTRSYEKGGPTSLAQFGIPSVEEVAKVNIGYSTNPADNNYKPHDIYGQVNTERTKEADNFVNFGKPWYDVDGITRFTSGPLTKKQTTENNLIADLLDNFDSTPMVYDPKDYFNVFKETIDPNLLPDYVKKYGGYNTRSYAPGGFMGMDMANAGMMNTGAMGMSADPEGCMCADGSTHTSCCHQGYEGGSQEGITGKNYQGMFRGRNLPFRHRRALKKADVNLAQTEGTFEKGLTGSGGSRSTAPANWANLNLDNYSEEDRNTILNSKLFKADPAGFSAANPGLLSKQDLKQAGQVKSALEWTPAAQETGFTSIPINPGDRGNTREGDSSGTLRGPGMGSTPVIRTDHNFTKSGKLLHNIQPWNWTKDKFVRSNPTKMFQSSGNMKTPRKPLFRRNEFGGNLMQPANEMRRGGKMCYGCGGAMHAYGGRMDGIAPNQAKYGKWLDFASNLLGAGASVVGNIPLVGQAIGAGLGTLSGVTESLAENAATSEDGGVDWKGIDWGDMGVKAGVKAAAGGLGAAGGLAVGAGGAGIDALTTSKYEKKEAMYQDILANPEKYSLEQFEEALGRQEEMGKNSGLFNAINTGVGIAGSIAGGKVDKAGDAALKGAEVATDVAKTADTVVSASDNILPEAFDAASAAVDATKTAETVGNFITKANNVADNKFVQQGVSMGMDALDKVDQANTQKTVGKELTAQQKRAEMMTNDPDSMYYNPINQPINMATAGAGMMANGGYMGTRSYRAGGGLWANIHAKRKRGEPPLKPGEEGYPTAKAIKASQNAMGGRMYNLGGYMSPMFAGPEINDEEVAGIINQTTNDDGTYGGDMDNAFIDMSMNANPADLISPMYNIGMGLFGKSADTSYDVEQFTSIPFDFTETKNALRRQTAKAMNALTRKGTGNPSNLLALTQIGAKLEADYLQKTQNINIQREQAAKDRNTVAQNAYEKQQKELQLKEKAIRDELIKTGLKDIQSISDKNAQTEYMFKFMQAMAPDVVKGSYKNMSQVFMDIFKKKQKKSKP